MAIDGSLPVVCRACGQKVRMDSIRFDEARKQYVCQNCLKASKKISELKGTQTFEPRTKPMISDTRSQTEKIQRELVRYSCPRCNYHFTRRREAEVKDCPYCGHKKLEFDESTASAASLVKNSRSYF